MNAKELFIDVDNAKIFCRIFGNKNLPILVVHGGPGLGQNYLLPHMAEIEKFSTAIFYDQRGSGQSASEIGWQVNPFQTYVQDIEQLRIALGLEKISLLAHSWGGILASLYALDFPHRVTKVIYLNSVPLSSADYLTFVKHRSQIVDVNRDELMAIRNSAAFAQGDPKTVENYYHIYFRKYFIRPENVNALNLRMSPDEAINNFNLYDFFYNYVSENPFDLYGQLTKLDKLSLIVACESDVVPIHYQKKIHQSIPSSEYVFLKECGHFPFIDQPEDLFKILQDFICR